MPTRPHLDPGNGNSNPDDLDDDHMDIKEVPTVHPLQELLRMEDAGAGGKRQRQVKFGRLSDDVWPDGETLNQAKRKSIPRSTKAAGQENQSKISHQCSRNTRMMGPMPLGQPEDSLSFSSMILCIKLLPPDGLPSSGDSDSDSSSYSQSRSTTSS